MPAGLKAGAGLVKTRGVRFERMTFGQVWRAGLAIEALPDQVHVWGFVLDTEDADLARATHLLSSDEQERANRLVHESHRRQFVVAHASLRVVLSRYCGKAPRELIIRKTESGKPFLPLHPSIRFNLTHSHGRGLIAIAKDREVGIDLEQIGRRVDVERLARRFLSREDQEFIERGEPLQQDERFLRVWVAREALFKAEGTGITFPLHRDHVELTGDGTEGRLIRGTGRPGGADMPIRYLSLESGWVGAVAAEGTDWTVACPGSS
jgi:4'-phosphopantetheinyl transferase